MNATVFAAINDQINSEFKASYTYLAMAAYCESQKFLGAANWLRMQSEEERQHGLAHGAFSYMVKPVTIGTLPKVGSAFT